jgi:hypothetical protein
MRRTAVVLVTGLALVASGCGNEKRLTRAEFLKRGNAICKSGNAKTEAATKKEFPNQNERPDPQKFKAFANETLFPNVRQQINGIDDLKPPKDLEARVDQLVSDARAALDKLKEEVNKDPSAALDNENDPFAPVNKKATEIGLTTCAEG